MHSSSTRLVWRIARRDIVDMWREGRVRAAAIVVFALLAAAIAAGWIETARVRGERDAARRTVREQWLDQGTKNPHSAAHYGIYAVRPRTPLSLFDSGADPYTGVATWLEAHKQNESRYRPVRDTTVIGRSGQLTTAIVLQIVMPLLVILLLAPVIAHEREQGTLLMVLASGVTRGQLATGKVIGVIAALGALLGPASAIGAAAVLGVGPGATPDVLGRIAVLAAAYCVYLLAFVGISLAASALGRTARTALVVLLMVWACNTITPRAMSDVARRLAPLPSKAEIQAAIDAARRSGLDGHNPAPDRLRALETDVLRRYGVASVDALPINFEGILLSEDERYGNQIFDREHGRLWSRMAAQEQIHLAGALLGPLPALRAISQAVAGADWSHQRHFAEAAERYRRAMVQAMNDELTYRSGARAYGDNVKGAETWATVPDFTYVPPTLGEVLSASVPSVIVLLAWLLAGVTAAVAGVRRMA